MVAARPVPVSETPIQSTVVPPSASAELTPMPEPVAEPIRQAPLLEPAKVAASQATEPTLSSTPDVAVQKPVLTKPAPAATETEDLSKKATINTPTSNTKMIVGVALGVLLLVVVGGGGYWFMSKEKPAEPNLSATASTPSSAAPPVPVAQPADSEAPKAEAAPSPAIAATPMTAPPTSSTPAVTTQNSAATVTVKPTAVVATPKAAIVKKKSVEKPIQDVVKTVPSQPVASAPPVVPNPSSQPKPAARTIDEQFSSRTAAECVKDFTWIYCREKIRFSVCEGKWSDTPPAGQSVCKGTATTNKNSN